MTTLQLAYTIAYAAIFIAAITACVVCAVRDARAARRIRERMRRLGW